MARVVDAPWFSNCVVFDESYSVVVASSGGLDALLLLVVSFTACSYRFVRSAMAGEWGKAQHNKPMRLKCDEMILTQSHEVGVAESRRCCPSANRDVAGVLTKSCFVARLPRYVTLVYRLRLPRLRFWVCKVPCDPRAIDIDYNVRTSFRKEISYISPDCRIQAPRTACQPPLATNPSTIASIQPRKHT